MESRVTITAYSKPNYDDWGPDTYWSIADWQAYYVALLEEFGKTEAKQKWIAAFNNESAPSFGAARAGYLSDMNFAKWLKSVKMYENVSTGLNGVLTDALLFLEGSSRRVIDTAGNVVKNTTGALNFTSYLLPVIVLVALFIIYKVANQRLNIA